MSVSFYVKLLLMALIFCLLHCGPNSTFLCRDQYLIVVLEIFTDAFLLNSTVISLMEDTSFILTRKSFSSHCRFLRGNGGDGQMSTQEHSLLG